MTTFTINAADNIATIIVSRLSENLFITGGHRSLPRSFDDVVNLRTKKKLRLRNTLVLFFTIRLFD